MIRSLGVLGLLLAFAISTTTAEDIQGPKWEPLEFKVTKPDAGTGFLRELNTGTSVVARLDLLGQNIITIDGRKSKLDSFTDDLNTDLLRPPAGDAPPKAAFGMAPQVSGSRSLTGRKPSDITFRGPGCLAKGATKVRIKGTVVVLVGKGEKVLEKKDVGMNTGVDLDIGSLKPSAGTFGTRRSPVLNYEGTRPIASITLLDADGKEIPSRFTSDYRTAGGFTTQALARATVMPNDRKVDRCTVRIKYYDSVEEVKVPVDLDVGPGL